MQLKILNFKYNYYKTYWITNTFIECHRISVNIVVCDTRMKHRCLMVRLGN